eukprot:g17867.t1
MTAAPPPTDASLAVAGPPTSAPETDHERPPRAPPTIGAVVELTAEDADKVCPRPIPHQVGAPRLSLAEQLLISSPLPVTYLSSLWWVGTQTGVWSLCLIAAFRYSLCGLPSFLSSSRTPSTAGACSGDGSFQGKWMKNGPLVGLLQQLLGARGGEAGPVVAGKTLLQEATATGLDQGLVSRQARLARGTAAPAKAFFPETPAACGRTAGQQGSAKATRSPARQLLGALLAAAKSNPSTAFYSLLSLYFLANFFTPTKHTGAFRTKAVRRSPLFRMLSSYYPHKNIVTTPLTGKQYFFGMHPHGVLALTLAPTFADGCGFETELFPQLQIQVCTRLRDTSWSCCVKVNYRYRGKC